MRTADEIFREKAKEERQEKISEIGEVLTGVTKKFIKEMEDFENGKKPKKTAFEKWLRYFILILLVIATIDFLFGSAWLIKSAVRGIF